MKSNRPAQRVGIFVDVQNMFYSAYDCFRGRLNYKKLLDTASGGRQVVRAIAYAMRDSNDQSSFFTMLREVGFELRTKEPRVRPDGTRKGGWDMGIAIEALTLAPKLDVVCLVSGDGDFLELVHALRAQGVRVEVYAFERTVGRDLREAADAFVIIGEELIFREGPGDAPPAAQGAPAPEAVPASGEPAPLGPAGATQEESTTRETRETRGASSFGAGLLNDDEPDEEADDGDDEIEEVV